MMKTQTIALLLIALIAAGTAKLAAEHKESLPLPVLLLDKTNGKAPFTITVVAPAELRDNLIRWQQETVHNKWGAGFVINWGDGSGAGDSANRVERVQTTVTESELAKHTFKTPGSYTVSASLYHFMPDDSHQVYWESKAAVTVK